jgi:hypothetical protein
LKPVLKPEAKVPPGYAKLELGLWGGLIGSRTLGSTAYQDSWSTHLETSVVERTFIDVRTGNIPAFGASITYFFHPHTGIKLLAGLSRSRPAGPPRMEFSWTLPDGSRDERASSPAGTEGVLTSIPLGFNFVERLTFGRWRLEASAGPTYCLHRFSQESAFGYAVVKSDPMIGRPDLAPAETYDALAVPLKIGRTTWRSWGANIGAGVHFQAWPLLAFAVEARYFHSPAKTLTWAPQTGSYDGLFTSEFPAEPFGAEDIASLEGNGRGFTLRVNPAVFRLSFGVLITFGR